MSIVTCPLLAALTRLAKLSAALWPMCVMGRWCEKIILMGAACARVIDGAAIRPAEPAA